MKGSNKKFMKSPEVQEAGYIYIGTTKTLSAKNYYKIGRTSKLSRRESQLNTSHPAHEPFEIIREYKVKDATVIEKIIHASLERLRPNLSREYFVGDIDKIVEVVKNIVDLVNAIHLTLN